jgi:hypothetical protein
LTAWLVEGIRSKCSDASGPDDDGDRELRCRVVGPAVRGKHVFTKNIALLLDCTYDLVEFQGFLAGFDIVGRYGPSNRWGTGVQVWFASIRPAVSRTVLVEVMDHHRPEAMATSGGNQGPFRACVTGPFGSYAHPASLVFGQQPVQGA